MTQTAVTMAFVALFLLIILIVVHCITGIDYKKLIKRIRKRSWDK